MSRITIQTIESAAPEVRPRLEKVKNTAGFVPNLLGVLATSPTAIETYQTVSGINARNGLTPVEREVVQITAATNNGCRFCSAGHARVAAKKLGVDQREIDSMRAKTALADAKLDALAKFTTAVMDNRGRVSDRELEAFRNAGYSEANVLDVLLGVSLASLCNYANNVAQTPINPELEPFVPVEQVAAAAAAR